MSWHITNAAIYAYLDLLGATAPEGSPAWTNAQRELESLLSMAAAEKQPKQDGAQLVYKVRRDLVRRAIGEGHVLAKWDGASMELYLHVDRDRHLVTIRRRRPTSRRKA
jgi:hypothetical protein